MDKAVNARFERLEKSLTNLIDSVSKYHPSTVYAEELRAADDDLHKELEEVEKHQNNYLRIQKLRQTSAVLDTQIKETLQSLANTRKDILATQTTNYPSGPNNTIVYEELLRYGRRISKTTMPPAGIINNARQAIQATAVSSPPAEGQTPLPESQQPPNASMTPSAAPTPSQPQTPAAAMNGLSISQMSQSQQQSQPSTNAPTLPDEIKTYLNPLSGQPFFPWPAEDKIRSGALAANQILIERGIEPKGFDPQAEAERKRQEETDRKEREEKEKQEREEVERKAREERERARRQREKEQEEWRRRSSVAQQDGIDRSGAGAGLAGTGQEGEKKRFQFTNLDDLDDDDDEDD